MNRSIVTEAARTAYTAWEVADNKASELAWQVGVSDAEFRAAQDEADQLWLDYRTARQGHADLLTAEAKAYLAAR